MKLLAFVHLIILLTYCKFVAPKKGAYVNKIKNVPYTVSLQEKPFGHFCTGALVSKRWVVTAAQCVWGKKPSDIFIRAASSYKNKGGKIRKAIKIIIHPLFKRIEDVPFDYDVALVKLKKKLSDHSVYIGYIPVSSPYVMPALIGSDCLVSGWVISNKTDKQHQRLKSATVEIVGDLANRCQDKVSPKIVTRNMVCIGAQKSDACLGDLGNPTVCSGLLVGVSSWGERCATPEQPGVNTFIPEMWDFIASHVDVDTSYKANSNIL
uniref:trypsin n=1 Tax=Aedes albopictus TaxID=7160 RepID=A0A023EP13_AEDAL